MKKSKTSQTLVERLMAELKIGEEGKFQNFFNKELRDLERSVTANERTIDNLEFKLSGDLKDLDLQIEDAEQGVQDAYKNISIEDIDTNAKQKDFSNAYWHGVSSAEEVVNRLKDKKEATLEEHDTQVEYYQDQIDKLQKRINVITGNE